jgi:hypothetical protein
MVGVARFGGDDGVGVGVVIDWAQLKGLMKGEMLG